MIRKSALQIGAPALLGFMAWNAYLAVNHLKQTQKVAALTLESSMIQADISSVLKDLTDMENLRVGLANRAERERSLESQLESLAKSKQAEMERSIGLREQGYRHRAFMLVDSNEGMEYMNRARGLLSSLSLAETRSARLDRERNASLRKALAETIIANSCLLLLTICLFGLMRYHAEALEQE